VYIEQLNKLNMRMSLIEKTYHILKQAGLAATQQAFSRDYVSKNANWFAYQAHMKRNFCITSAIQCLRCIRLKRVRDAALGVAQLAALASAEALLLEHLKQRYLVAEVCV
jgi:hypothetical protein